MPIYDLPGEGHYDPPLKRKYGILPLRFARVNKHIFIPKYSRVSTKNVPTNLMKMCIFWQILTQKWPEMAKDANFQKSFL